MQIKAFASKRPRVEMVPLIDCFFLLLVFFIYGVFSMTMQQGILVELPAAATAVASKDEALTISLAEDGSMFLNQEPVTQAVLRDQLQQRQAESPEALVIINADQRVPHGEVVAVLDAVRQAGLARVSFQARHESDQR